MKFMRRGLAAAATAALLTFAGSTAQAAQDDVSAELAEAGVESTPELTSYLETLSPSERQEFINTKLPANIETTSGPQQPLDATAQASLAEAQAHGAEATPVAAGCWTARSEGEATALLGNTLFTYYHVGAWCSDGLSVTDASVVDYGGETASLGWRYEGGINTDAGVVANEGRSYSQQKFVFGTGGWDIQTPTPCIRVSGYASGDVVADEVCGIY